MEDFSLFTQFEEKGKIHTPVITKKPLEVIVQTPIQQIRGFLHIKPDSRMVDAINEGVTFIVLTDARILDQNGILQYSVNFLVLNTTQIIWIFPVEELRNSAEIK